MGRQPRCAWLVVLLIEEIRQAGVGIAQTERKHFPAPEREVFFPNIISQLYVSFRNKKAEGREENYPCLPWDGRKETHESFL